MTNEILIGSEMCQVLSAVPEKFVVDFANNIPVLKDHERSQREPKNVFKRLYHGVTGQSWQRQHEINSSLISIAEAQLHFLTELNKEVAFGFKAIDRVAHRVNAMASGVAELTDFAIDTRKALDELHHQVFTRFEQVEQRLANLELKTSADNQLDRVFNKWAAGDFIHLPIASRAYAVLEELNWGDYGLFIRTVEPTQLDYMMEDLSNRLIIQIREDTGFRKLTRVDYRHWLKSSYSNNSDYQLAVEYLSEDYCEKDAPFVYSLSSESNMPLTVPRICTAERLSDALVEEVLGGINGAK